MKLSIHIISFLVLAFTGAAGLAYYQYQTPDVRHIANRVSEQLLKIDSLDSAVSEFALRNRVNIDQNYDQLSEATKSLERAIKKLKTDYFRNALKEDSIIKKHFDEFENLFESKKDFIENFKSHYSVLRNSENYAPIVGQKLMFTARKQGLSEVSEFYGAIIFWILEHSKQGKEESKRLKALLLQIPETENQMPEESISDIIEFTNHIEVMIEEKKKTDLYLKKALSSPSRGQIERLQKEWNAWFVDSGRPQDNFTIAVLVYILFLLIGTVYISFRLRFLYLDLDAKINKPTTDKKDPFTNQEQSEKLSQQVEDFAQFRRILEGVLGETNTPLENIINSIEIVRNNMKQIEVIFDSSESMSEIITQKPIDTNKLGAIVKRNVIDYRKIRNNNISLKTDESLKEISYNLNNISQLINSLKRLKQTD